MTEIRGGKYLTPTEAAYRLGTSEGTLRNERCRGKSRIPFVKIGGAVLYPEWEVEAYLRLHETTGA